MSGKRISTGIVELDLLIEGGLRAGKTYLVVGQPGTGKTVFGLQFLVNGLMEKEKGLYVAIDEKPADVIEQAASLGWDLAPFIESREFLILDASAYFNTRVSDGGNKGVDVERVVADLRNYITRMGASRVVIDPVGPLLFSRDTTARALDQARMLFYGLQANLNTTNLLTTYAVERNVRGIEEYLVSGTIVLEMELANSRYVRTLTIEKMRSTALAPAQYVFTIVQDRGIVLQGMSETAIR
ncbi:MAG TPA: ATPase domain-containing protein [Candidatus Limnocylindria bacterium]|nr:ATPase domain-containing protein [Candidatus Limnocylindria bacterium]